MRYHMRGFRALGFICAVGIALFLLLSPGGAEAQSDCYLKCFITEDDVRVCVVEGHRLYDDITVRTERGDLCFSSIDQGRAAGYLILGGPEQQPAEPQIETEAAPDEAPTVTTDESRGAVPDETPEVSQPEPEATVGAETPASQAVDEIPDDTVEESVQDTPPVSAPDDGMTPAEREKQELMARMGDENLSMAEREQAYQQLINRPDLTEEERQTVEFLWSFVAGGGMQDMVRNMLTTLLFGPVGIILLVIVLFFIVCGWVIFSKAGVPGILSLIPIVNVFFIVKIAGKPLWWFILCFIPIVNIIISLLVCLALAERFGKGALMGIVLFFLPFIGLPILAFTGEYQD